MKACTFYIVRHGQSEDNRNIICGGHRDTPLTELGVQQAEQAKHALTKVHFDTVYSSDLQRASKTAEIVFGSPVPASHLLADLRERTFGKLEGQSNDIWIQLSKQYSHKYQGLPLEERWKHSYADYIEGNGPLSARFLKALKAIAAEHPGETVLIGTHGGPIRTTLMKLGYADEADLPPESFGNSGYVVLDCDGQKFEIRQVETGA